MAQLFVYGTLREGGTLSSWLGGYRSTARTATATGKLYEHPRGDYPVMKLSSVDEDGKDVVVGEVITVPDDDPAGLDELYQLLMMEQNAGYVPKTIPVLQDDGENVKAWVCAWPLTERTGRRIKHGDWIAYEIDLRALPRCLDCGVKMHDDEAATGDVCLDCESRRARACKVCGASKSGHTSTCWTCGGTKLEPAADDEDERIPAVLLHRPQPGTGVTYRVVAMNDDDALPVGSGVGSTPEGYGLTTIASYIAERKVRIAAMLTVVRHGQGAERVSCIRWGWGDDESISVPASTVIPVDAAMRMAPMLARGSWLEGIPKP
jgi:gamma-glutamylcyclotransferase (GGCT)/AIG2-like uncharacterized protein YtfP